MGAGNYLSRTPMSWQGSETRTQDSSPLASAEAGAEGVPSGDAIAFSQVYRDYFPFVWRTLRGFGLAGAELEDSAQDVFVVVHRRLGEFEGRSSLRTWLYAIVRHVAFNHRRTKQRKAAPLVPFEDAQGSDESGPHQAAESAEVSRFLRAFLDSIDDDKRAIFGLVVVEELPVPEAAEILGIPLNTAYFRVRAVKSAFREAAARRQELHP